MTFYIKVSQNQGYQSPEIKKLAYNHILNFELSLRNVERYIPNYDYYKRVNKESK